MLTALVQCNYHLVVLLYLKLPFELHRSRLLLRSYRQPLTNQTLPDYALPAFIKVSLGADSSSLKVAGLHTMIRNSLSPAVCLSHTVICKYLINIELYLTFSKYGDKLLVMKSLINILKFTYFNIVFYQFFSRYLWSHK